jgi:hypothetical protein
MFDGPECASYIALMRELRLPREFDDGDYYTAPVPVSPIAPDGFEVLIWVDLYRWPRATEESVWLPRLDQWLGMLEEAGADQVLIEHVEPHDDYGPGGYICFTLEEGHDGLSREKPDYEDGWHGFYALCRPTREEAAARLWMAVTGRTVPA